MRRYGTPAEPGGSTRGRFVGRGLADLSSQTGHHVRLDGTPVLRQCAHRYRKPRATTTAATKIAQSTINPYIKDRRLSVLRHSEQIHCRLIGHCNPLDVYHEFSNQRRGRRSGLGSPQIEHTVSPLASRMGTFHSPFVVRIVAKSAARPSKSDNPRVLRPGGSFCNSAGWTLVGAASSRDLFRRVDEHDRQFHSALTRQKRGLVRLAFGLNAVSCPCRRGPSSIDWNSSSGYRRLSDITIRSSLSL